MVGLLLFALVAFATLPATLGLVAPPLDLGLASGLAVDVLNNATTTTTLSVSFSVLSVSSFGSPPLATTSAAQTSLPSVTMPVLTSTTTPPWTTATGSSSLPVETLQMVTLLEIPVPIAPIVINLTDNASKITLTVTSTALSTATLPPSPPTPSSAPAASQSKALSKGAIISTVFACVLACWFLFCVAVLLRLRQEQRQKDRQQRTQRGSPEGLDSVIHHYHHHRHHDNDDFDGHLDHSMQTLSVSASPPSPVLHSTPADAPTPTPLPGVRLSPHAEVDVQAAPITPPRDMPAPGLFHTPTPAPASPVAAASPTAPAPAELRRMISRDDFELWARGVNIAPVRDDYRSELSFVSRAVSRRRSV